MSDNVAATVARRAPLPQEQGLLKVKAAYKRRRGLNYVLCQFRFLDGRSGRAPRVDAALGN